MVKAPRRSMTRPVRLSLSSPIQTARIQLELHNLQLTELRRLVFETLLRSDRAFSAYDILGAINADQKKYTPAAIYGAIEALIAAGLVRRVRSIQAFVARDPSLNSMPLFVCSSCRRVARLESRSILPSIMKAARETSFQIANDGVEIFGLCAVCQSLDQP